ncbi:MAG: hypothetical protein L0241_17295, partial [Planctomycetia bacterium]|nr:hypothetical protein [Planctomycetia bacterium]
MPPRIATAGILAFWLLTTAFVAYRDLWPRLFSSGPPPVAIDLADEAKQNIPAKWTLYRNGQKVGKLTTQMKYHDSNDTFQFTYRYSQLRLEQGSVTLVVPDGVSEVWITRSGNLKEQTISGKVEVEAQNQKIAEGTIEVRGTVTNGIL